MTPNDPGDGDDNPHGPNGVQNFPVLASAAGGAGGTTVQGSSGGAACGFESAAQRGKPLGRVLCQVGDLAPGAGAAATVTGTPTQAGTLTATAGTKQAPPSAVDPNGANNQVAVTTTVTP